MITINPFNQSSSAHWYHADGTPAHDSDLRGARKQNLFFSVTTILKMWPKTALDAWKIKNAVETCLANPIQENESHTAYKDRIAIKIDTALSDAAEWGREIHRLFESYATTGKFPDGVAEQFLDYLPCIEAWFKEHVDSVLWSEKVLVSQEYGYAGTCDLAIKSKKWGTAICDFKRRGFYEGKMSTYDTDPMQLVAYSKCADFPVDTLVSVGINRDEAEVANHVWQPKKYEDYWAKFLACYKFTCVVKNYMPQIQYELPFTTQP